MANNRSSWAGLTSWMIELAGAESLPVGRQGIKIVADVVAPETDQDGHLLPSTSGLGEGSIEDRKQRLESIAEQGPGITSACRLAGARPGRARHRDPRCRRRDRKGMGAIKLVVATLEVGWAASQQQSQDGQRLIKVFGPLGSRRERYAVGLMLHWMPAGTDAQFDATAGEHARRRDDPGQHCRVSVHDVGDERAQA